MSFIRTIGKQIALQVSAVVARHELFERYGDRPVQPPLDSDAWSHGPEAGELAGDEDPPEILGAAAIKRVVADGPAVVHHWATWCESCVDEADQMATLAARSGVKNIAISWDSFEGGDADAALRDVSSNAHVLGPGWRHLVARGTPQHFFKTLGVKLKQVPQTWLVSSTGDVLHRFEGPMSGDDLDALIAKVSAL